MEKETTGAVIAVKALGIFGLRIPFGEFVCPHIVKVKYTADGKDYTKWLWIGRHDPVPPVGSSVKVIYCEENPTKANFF